MVHIEVLKPIERQTHTWGGDFWVTRVSEVPHWIKMRRMSGKYNIIEHISIGFRPFGLKCVCICNINYSRKLSKVFFHPARHIWLRIIIPRVSLQPTCRTLKRPNSIKFGLLKQLLILSTWNKNFILIWLYTWSPAAASHVPL